MPYERHPLTGCRADSLLGPWCIEPMAFDALHRQAQGYDLAWLADYNARAEMREREAAEKDKADGKPDPLPYALTDKGVAVLPVTGPTSKYPTSFQRVMGGTSTLLASRAMRHATENPDVRSILMHVDSPGGTAEGLFLFADEIRRADAVKPVFAHGDDKATSAAQLILSQARRSTASAATQLGSIGTLSYLVDASQKTASEGLRVIPVAAGKFKAAGLPGTRITDEQIAYFQSRIDDTNKLFVDGVSRGRRLTPGFIQDLEARVFRADDARNLNLIDQVCGFDEAVAYAERVA